MNGHRITSVCLLFLLTATMLVGSVVAEGARESSMYDVYTGFNFRDFYDGNTDATSTYTTLGVCYLPNPQNPYPIQLNLWEVHSWAPDYDRGAEIYYGSSTGYWGRMSANTYHFTVTDYNGDGPYRPLSCETVNYGW